MAGGFGDVTGVNLVTNTSTSSSTTTNNTGMRMIIKMIIIVIIVIVAIIFHNETGMFSDKTNGWGPNCRGPVMWHGTGLFANFTFGGLGIIITMALNPCAVLIIVVLTTVMLVEGKCGYTMR